MKKQQHTIEIIIGVLGVIGVLWFGMESPETRENITELYLAGSWLLFTLSTVSSFWSWSESPWYRKFIAIMAPMITVLYLFKYLQG